MKTTKHNQLTKKHRLAPILLLTLVGGLILTGCGMPAQQKPTAGAGRSADNGARLEEIIKEKGASLTQYEALHIALTHAGVSEVDVIYKEEDINLDDGRLEYEIEFYVGSTEYEYDVDAVSGEILRSSKKEKTVSVKPDSQPEQPATPPTTFLTVDEAIAIALKHAGVTEEQVRFDDRDFDRDHGKQLFEIEFYVGSTEYEYDVDAVSGEILRTAKKENITANPPVTETQAYITEAEAISTALTHAGIAQADAKKLKAEFDIDDGRAEFSVDFKAGGYEYEYEIDAVTGTILECDKEFDD